MQEQSGVPTIRDFNVFAVFVIDGDQVIAIIFDDRFASDTNPGSCYFDYLEFAPLPNPNRKPKTAGYADTRVEEPMGRGVVALPRADGSVYVGWRLLKSDPADTAFDVSVRNQDVLSLLMRLQVSLSD